MPIDLEALRRRIANAKVGVDELAKLAEVDRSTVRRVRDGKTDPSVTIFNRLDAALKSLRKKPATAKA